MTLLFHLLFLSIALTGVIVACRWMIRRSSTLGWLVVCGVVIRTASSSVLFAVSALDSGFLAPVHTGDGFWDLAPDARVYYELAGRVATGGLSALATGGPSPSYVTSLGLWLRASGVFALNAILFNVVCYVVTCLAIVAYGHLNARGRLVSGGNHGGTPLFLALASLTFSPILLLTATQVLKDAFFAMLIVLACVAILKTLNWVHHRELGTGRFALAWGLLGATAQYGIAGTRAYYAVFVWMALAVALAVLLCLVPRGRRFTTLGWSAGLLSVLWVAFVVGAGPYYGLYAEIAAKATGLPVQAMSFGRSVSMPSSISEPDASGLGNTVVRLRAGFARTGGATNLAAEETPRGDGGSMVEVAEDLAIGLLAMFVPIGILQRLSVVSFGGGRGLLAVTDLDTLFINLTLIGCGVLLARRRKTFVRQAPSIAFAMVLFFVSSLLLAYVVTNFGTLFRLRLLAIAPAWLAPLALVAGEEETSGSLDVRHG